MTYNLCVGGKGGWDHIDSDDQAVYAAKGRAKQRWLIDNEPEWQTSKNINIADSVRGDKNARSFSNKKHTTESKARIGAANAVHQKGKKNSQYGTCWIHNNNVSKKINKDELDQYLTDGWIKGRKIKFG